MKPLLIPVLSFLPSMSVGTYTLAEARGANNLALLIVGGAITLISGVLVAVFVQLNKHTQRNDIHITPGAPAAVTQDTCHATAKGLGHSIDDVKATTLRVEGKQDNVLKDLGNLQGQVAALLAVFSGAKDKNNPAG